MKMADVCAVFERAGMRNVSYVLASGNIIFGSDADANVLKTSLEHAMSRHFGYDCTLFLKKEEDVKIVLENNPFQKADDFHVYALIGEDGAARLLMDEFCLSARSEGEAAEIKHHTFYWKIRKGNTLGSSFGKVLGRKSMKSLFTSRNINTFEKIIKQFS